MSLVTIKLVETFATITFFPDAKVGGQNKADAFADETDAILISDEADLVTDAYSAKELVHVYNSAVEEIQDLNPSSRLKTTKRFASSKAAASRTMTALEILGITRAKVSGEAPEGLKTIEGSVKKVAKVTKIKAAGTQRASKGVNLKAKDWLKPCREGTKQQIMLDMLAREEGATLDQLRVALSQGRKPWADQTIKSGFNWDMNSVKGYGVKTVISDAGVHTYHIVLPEGVSKPLPPTPRKG